MVAVGEVFLTGPELWGLAGLIFSPVLYNQYMNPLAKFVQRFGIGCHQYTDDTKLSLLLDKQPAAGLSTLSQCLDAAEGRAGRS